MTHKKVNNADPGTASKFGGNDLDKWSDFASGVDTDDYDINADTQFRQDKLQVRNAANTFGSKFRSLATAARTVTYPDSDFTIGSFTGTSTDALLNKTIDSELNTISKAWSGYDYIIYRSGTATKCRDMGLGTTVSSDTSPDVPIQFALTNGVGKDIYIATGTYSIAAVDLTFIGARTRIKLSPGAIIEVPNGYTGHVWNLTRVTADTTSLSNITIDGGQYQEAGTPVNNWDCIYCANTNGTTGDTAILFNRFMNMYIRHAGNGVHLYSNGARGWINGNIWQNVVFDNNKTGILFDYQGTVSEANGANRNQFLNVIMQCNTKSTVGGFIDVSGEGNIFNDCKVWDIAAAGVGVATSCNVHQRAENTLFIGGIIRTQNFVDLGLGTMFFDVVTGDIYPFLKLPSRKKFGMFQGTGWDATNWDGILRNMTVSGTQTALTPSSTNGRGVLIETSSTINTAAGWKSGSYVTMRAWKPRLKARFRLTNAAANSQRLFIGFKVASADLTADNYLSADYGIGLGIDSTLTNFRLLRNDNVGTTVTASTGVAIDTAVREMEIWFDPLGADGAGSWNYKLQVLGSTTAIDNVAGSFYSTDIPSSTAELRVVCQIGTAAAAVKGLELYYLEVESDK